MLHEHLPSKTLEEMRDAMEGDLELSKILEEKRQRTNFGRRSERDGLLIRNK